MNSNFKKLINKKCWGVLAGSPNYHHIELHFGDKILRSKKIENPKIDADLQMYYGQFKLSIDTEWRLHNGDRIITSSYEPNIENGPLVTGMDKIKGFTLSDAKMLNKFGDFKLQFDNYVLMVFCLNTGNADNNYRIQTDNWTLWEMGKMIIANKVGCELTEV